jgi:hypothetical protein
MFPILLSEGTKGKGDSENLSVDGRMILQDVLERISLFLSFDTIRTT